MAVTSLDMYRSTAVSMAHTVSLDVLMEIPHFSSLIRNVSDYFPLQLISGDCCSLGFIT